MTIDPLTSIIEATRDEVKARLAVVETKINELKMSGDSITFGWTARELRGWEEERSTLLRRLAAFARLQEDAQRHK